MIHLFFKYSIGFIFLSTTFLISACQDSQHSTAGSEEKTELEVLPAVPAPPFAYNLNQPDKKTKLPSSLKEVSGLSYIEGGQIAMVQDEVASIFIFDIDLDSVVTSHRFGFQGDFEGIEIQGNKAYVIRSDGMLYEVNNYTEEEPATEKYQTPLSPATNPEGLGYLAKEGVFIIAGKEEYLDMEKDEKIDHLRAFYSYDPQTHQLETTPLFTVDLNDIKPFISQYARTENEKEWVSEFDPEKAASFKPSGIAQHPLTGEIFITASAGKLLVVLDSTFQFSQAHYLDRDIFKQPEGICFSPSGDLYISNEGRNGKGNILWFVYRP